MNRKDIEKYFCNILQKEEDVSAGIAAIRTLLEIIKNDRSSTVQELDENLKVGIDVMRNTNYPITAINSGCELFLRFITFAKLDRNSIEDCKVIMLNRGLLFLKKLNEARAKIVKLAGQFIVDGSQILTHSRSRVVLQTLKEAAKQKKRFHVYATISAPDDSGYNSLINFCCLCITVYVCSERIANELQRAGIACTLILDSAVGYVMEKVDFIMVGAEGVVESGGIINKIGTYTIGLCAKEMKKPLYVLTESFKFTRLYPLSQGDLPDEYKYTKNMRNKDLKAQHPLVDYTPPTYITLLFTDLGILTPSAVSDELINLYL
ncbi:translation initiation factor eif-2b subunit alpha [Holotrichia oblita]|uniref:Translation initiation factor eif-2b subunit alpha n=1 Tax=Holotrichia oblita TaxID=644536 RepID=A0ACB9SXN1_HOLOL|nr:translation initiation factor eif-2b subunit alpha [Holotrichia oblita]